MGPYVDDVVNKTDCINKGPPYRWANRKYNFDNLGQVSELSGSFEVNLLLQKFHYMLLMMVYMEG